MFDNNCIFWCKECNALSYRLICCGNTLCNGGGCEDCIGIHNSLYEQLDKIQPKVNLLLLKRTGKLEISE